jgi:hypothetical protein
MLADATTRAEPGPLLFARYALPPNSLGYCGPDEARSLLEHIREGVVDPDLVRLERAFEGAYPYLSLIAAQNGIADPLDRRVVEAYWLGNELLDGVDPRAFAADLERRFRSRTPAKERPWLAEPARRGLPPHHNTHVLAVMPRIGLLRSGLVPDLVELLGRCLIRPARVLSVEHDHLTVLASPLIVDDGHLALGPLCEERVSSLLDGSLAPNDWVALHWGVAVDALDMSTRRRLDGIARAAATRISQTA